MFKCLYWKSNINLYIELYTNKYCEIIKDKGNNKTMKGVY